MYCPDFEQQTPAKHPNGHKRQSPTHEMSKSQQKTQSAMERRSAEAESKSIIARLSTSHSKLVSAVRRKLRKRLPSAHELVYEYRDWFVISFVLMCFILQANDGGATETFRSSKISVRLAKISVPIVGCRHCREGR